MTMTLRKMLVPGMVYHLHELYYATNSYTESERHNCRGCLSSLKRRGEVVSLGNCFWQGV